VTPAEARKAMRWCQKVLGLSHYAISLEFTDKEPDWSPREDGAIFLGRMSPDFQERTAKVWVGPAQCAEYDRDVLHTICHEMSHLALGVAGLMLNDSTAVEFMVDRNADALAFAYTHGMKPWR